METGKLSSIDMAIVIIYLIGMMWFGLRVSKSIKNDRDYFLGGKKLPWWAIGMSMVVSDIGALDIVGVAGTAYLYGIAMANFEWIGCIPAMIIGAFVFIPFYWRTGVFTVPEFLGRRYNQFVRTVVALIMGIFMSFLLGIFLYTAAKAINILIGWPEYVELAEDHHGDVKIATKIRLSQIPKHVPAGETFLVCEIIRIANRSG